MEKIGTTNHIVEKTVADTIKSIPAATNYLVDTRTSRSLYLKKITNGKNESQYFPTYDCL